MFHYTNEKGLCGLLSSKRLWLVSSAEMEDITDRFYANLFVTIALLCTDDEDVKKIRETLHDEDILQANMEALEIPFYSASFCMDSKNECLWEKYADRRKGVCIEFNEDYFYEYINKVMTEKKNILEEEEISQEKEKNPYEKNLIESRSVKYGYPVCSFLEVIKLTKRNYFPEQIDEIPSEHIKNRCKDWLVSVLRLFAGTIKSRQYEGEKEIRFLFQNIYTGKYAEKHPFVEICCYENERILKELGVDKEVCTDGKKRMELNIEEIFDDRLIKRIILGDNFPPERVNTLKKKLKEANLPESILCDRKGNKI